MTILLMFEKMSSMLVLEMSKALSRIFYRLEVCGCSSSSCNYYEKCSIPWQEWCWWMVIIYQFSCHSFYESLACHSPVIKYNHFSSYYTTTSIYTSVIMKAFLFTWIQKSKDMLSRLCLIISLELLSGAKYIVHNILR